MSAATIDRALREIREPEAEESAVMRHLLPRSDAVLRCELLTAGTIRRRGSSKRISAAHSGPTAKGSFVQTLTLTDIATGWTGARRCWCASRSC